MSLITQSGLDINYSIPFSELYKQARKYKAPCALLSSTCREEGSGVIKNDEISLFADL